MGNYKLISVESRKGGVGKTTAALNLGYLLREKYHVLLLDIDITGTSIRTIQKSRFWKEDAFLLEDLDGETINLLQYFANKYLKGEDLADFGKDGEEGKICVKEKTINVMASELYGEDAELLYDPSLLLESVHIFWLTEMILSICEKFSSCFSDGNSVIILDNSPGFVGIGKAVHGIINNMGPNDGKFLTVSSLDEQDLESSLKAILSIDSDYRKKLTSVLNPNSEESDSSFYSMVKLSGDTEYVYYKNVKKGAALASYQGLIINKVSKDITESRSSYDFSSMLSTVLAPVYDELTPEGETSIMVPFDAVLMTQFYGYLVHRKSTRETSHTVLKNRLATINNQVNRIEDLTIKELPLDLLRLCNGLDKSIDSLKGALIASGFEIMASKFSIEWSPITHLRRLLDVLKRAGFSSETQQLVFPKRSRMCWEMGMFKSFDHLSDFCAIQSKDIVRFCYSVTSVACEMSLCFSDSGSWHGVRFSRDPDDVNFARMEMIECLGTNFNNWIRSVVNLFVQADNRYLASFILSEKVSTCDHYLRAIIDKQDFVQTIKEAVSHLMDVVADVRTIINVVRAVTTENDGSFSYDVDLASFLNRKIVTKEYDFLMAQHMMDRDLHDSDYMESFREVLSRVINNWGI